jgi:hypothetical protein
MSEQNCPNCGAQMERRDSMFFWRGNSRPGHVCVPCNALYAIAGDEIEPLRQVVVHNIAPAKPDTMAESERPRLTVAPNGSRTVPNYMDLSEPDLLKALGADHWKWAVAFSQAANNGDWSRVIPEWAATWFANAMMVAQDAGIAQERERAALIAERLAHANLDAEGEATAMSSVSQVIANTIRQGS